MTDTFVNVHTKPETIGDKFAYRTVKFMRVFADAFFSKRYGHRAVVLETVAAVPGMVGGMLLHLKSLRLMKPDEGWIKTLLDEAENERMHLMAFVEMYKPSLFERLIVILAQGIFFNLYFVSYLINPKICHRIVGYLEEEACVSYTQYLEMIQNGSFENRDIPQWCKDYWKLDVDAKLEQLVIAIREDEAGHRDVNHEFADVIAKS